MSAQKKSPIKETYQFTLVLKNVDEKTPGLEDSLFQAGCDDALINFRNGTVYLDFDRKANSIEEAVISAINAVESAPIGAIVANVAPEDFVTESEISKRLSCKRQTVSLWTNEKRRKQLPFPKPIMKLSSRSPLWKWSEIAEWLYQNNALEKSEVVKALFLEDLNAVLEERDPKVRKSRQKLLEKFEDIQTNIPKYLNGARHPLNTPTCKKIIE